MVKRLRLNQESDHEVAPAKGWDYQFFDTDLRGFAVCIIAPKLHGPFPNGSSQQRLGCYLLFAT